MKTDLHILNPRLYFLQVVYINDIKLIGKLYLQLWVMNRVTQAVRPAWVSLAFHLNISLKTPL